MPSSPAIVQILPSLVSGGVERGTAEIARACLAHGFRSSVVSAGGPMVPQIVAEGSEHILLPVDSKNPLVLFKNVGRIREALADKGECLVHARSRAPAWSAFYAARAAGAPMVTTFHGVYSCGSALKRRYNAIMLKGERIVVASRYVYRHIVETYGFTDTERLAVIPRGFDPEIFSPKPDDAETVAVLKAKYQVLAGQRLILLPGRIAEWKGHHVFLEALGALPQKTGWVAAIVGDRTKHPEYYNRIKTLARRLGIEDRMRWIPHIDGIACLYKAADIVVNCSVRPETFGRTIVEAQALGRLVVASAHGGALDTVAHGHNGWLVPPGDKDALSETIHELLFLPEDVKQRVREAAARDASRDFSLKRMTDKTMALYDSVLQSFRSRKP